MSRLLWFVALAAFLLAAWVPRGPGSAVGITILTLVLVLFEILHPRRSRDLPPRREVGLLRGVFGLFITAEILGMLATAHGGQSRHALDFGLAAGFGMTALMASAVIAPRDAAFFAQLVFHILAVAPLVVIFLPFSGALAGTPAQSLDQIHWLALWFRPAALLCVLGALAAEVRANAPEAGRAWTLILLGEACWLVHGIRTEVSG